MHSLSRLRRGVALGVSLDLELCEVDEYLLEVSAGKLEVFDDALAKHVSELAEDIAEEDIASLDVDTLNFVAQVDVVLLGNNGNVVTGFGRGINTGIGRGINTGLSLGRTVVDELSRWNHLGDNATHAGLLVFKLRPLLFDLERVAVAVLRLQVVGGAKHNETTIDLDGKLVAKLLCLVHAMSCEQDRCHFHPFDHAVERAARNWINTTCRLVQEQDFGAEHESLGAAELTLVTTTEVL